MNDEVTRIYKGLAMTLEEAYASAKEVTDQLSWVESDALTLDVFIGLRDAKLIAFDGYRYYFIIKIIL